MLHFVIRAVPGKKVLGVERNLEMGVPPTQFYLFYGTVHMDIPGNTPPTHLILIDFSSTPDALFPGTTLISSLQKLKLSNLIQTVI